MDINPQASTSFFACWLTIAQTADPGRGTDVKEEATLSQDRGGWEKKKDAAEWVVHMIIEMRLKSRRTAVLMQS